MLFLPHNDRNSFVFRFLLNKTVHEYLDTRVHGIPHMESTLSTAEQGCRTEETDQARYNISCYAVLFNMSIQVKCKVSFDKIKLHRKQATGGVLPDICAIVTFTKLE